MCAHTPGRRGIGYVCARGPSSSQQAGVRRIRRGERIIIPPWRGVQAMAGVREGACFGPGRGGLGGLGGVRVGRDRVAGPGAGRVGRGGRGGFGTPRGPLGAGGASSTSRWLDALSIT